MTAPVPFAVFPVDEVLLDILPATECLLQGILIAEMLIEIEPAHHVLGLYPPVEAGQGFDIAIVLVVEGMLLDTAI
jgi:hypothetical protein